MEKEFNFDIKDFGKVVKFERQRLFLTQMLLSNQSNVSQAAITKIEQGGDCTLTTARKLCLALEIRIDIRRNENG